MNFIYSADINLLKNFYIISGVNDITHYNGSFISKISNTGDSLWTRYYTPIVWDDEDIAWAIIRDVAITNNGSILGAGSASTVEEGLWHSWIIHLDSMGCLIPGCELETGTISASFSNNFFSIFPNPANEFIGLMSKVNVEGNYNFYLSDVNGNIIKRASSIIIPGVQYLFNVYELNSGLYFLSFYDQMGNFLQTERIVILND